MDLQDGEWPITALVPDSLWALKNHQYKFTQNHLYVNIKKHYNFGMGLLLNFMHLQYDNTLYSK